MAGGKNHGKQGFKADRHGSCRRCGRDISSRHGNARYCTNCTGNRSRPYVHSVRVDEDTHEKLLQLARKSGKGRLQPVLEEIIKSALEGDD